MKESNDIKAAKITAWALIIASIIGGLFVLYTTSSQNDSVKVTGGNKQESQIVVANSVGDVTINLNTPSTETTAAISALEKRLEEKSKEIGLNRNDIQLLTRALRDLDQRTSGIVNMPDGRIKIGTIITGIPSIVIEEHMAAVKRLSQNDYATALEHSKKAIKAYEASELIQKKSTMYSGNLKKEDLSKLYYVGAVSAQFLRHAKLSYEWAQKAVDVNSLPEYRGFLATALFNLNRRDEAFKLIDEVIKQNPDNVKFKKEKEEMRELVDR